MKNVSSVVVALVTLFVATACNKTIESDDSIKLHASMLKVLVKGLSTDDSGVRDYDYSSPLEIALVRVDENASGSHYPYFQNTGEPLTAVMSAPNTSYIRDITFNSAQYFRNDNDHIRFASWYPADSEKATYSTTEGQVTFKIDGATDIMYGSPVDGCKNDGFDGIVFNHALCQFNIYAYKMNTGTEGDDDDVDWGRITGLVVDKVQKNLILTLPQPGSDRYEFSIPDGAEDLTTLSLDGAGNGIYWNPGSEIPYGFDNKEKVTSYLAAPPVGGYITLGISTSTRSPYQQISIARNFQPGCAYDIVLRFTSHGIINAEVSVGNWIYEKPEGDGNKIVQDVNADMYYDLSAYMTANSYIIPSGGYGYSFDGSVKGNGSERIAPEYIDILWSDNAAIWDSAKDESLSFASGGNYVQLASHHLSKNRIMVKVGNLDAADKSLLFRGNVIIAAYDHEGGNILWTWHLWLNDSVGTVGMTNGYLIHNQDLGSVPGSGGLYYQWGRKDPFRIGSFSVEDRTADLAMATANPTVFYSNGDTWYGGDQNDMKRFWGWNADNKEIAKSMYDPCPPGYQVPDYRMWNTSITSSLSLGNGYLDGSGIKQSEPLLLWSASFNKAGTDPYSFLYYSSTGNDQVQTERHRNYGGTIRCVAKSKTVVKDLSEAQTANSYIISGDGYYKFRANVAGNGVSSLITDKGIEWDMRGILWDPEYVSARFNPARIEYLWYQPALDSSIPESITTDNVCVKILDAGRLDADGYVNIEVENWQPGNVVLAARDEGGTILWSWHLWLTEKPSDQGNGMYTIMDRNLGATILGNSSTSATEALATYGMFYQWGRKDPFPGPPSANGGTKSTDSSTWFSYSGGSWTKKTAVQVMDGPVSIRSAAQNPDMFIEPKVQSSKYNVDKDPQRWHWMKGYMENDAFLFNKALWGYAIQDSGVGIYPSKTMYDPCPPGYTVAHHWVFWNSDTEGKGSNTISRSDFSSSGSLGLTCSKLASGNYLPLSGRRDYHGGYEKNGTTGFLWGSTPKSGGRTMEYGATYSGIYSDNRDWGYDQGNGQAVRCLKQ